MSHAPDKTIAGNGLDSYKANPTSMRTAVVDDKTGVEKKRLVNRQRWKGWAPISITYADSVPNEPPGNAKSEILHVNLALLDRLKEVVASASLDLKFYTDLLNSYSLIVRFGRASRF